MNKADYRKVLRLAIIMLFLFSTLAVSAQVNKARIKPGSTNSWGNNTKGSISNAESMKKQYKSKEWKQGLEVESGSAHSPSRTPGTRPNKRPGKVNPSPRPAPSHSPNDLPSNKKSQPVKA